MHVETILKQRADKSKPTLSSTGSSGSTADDMVTPLPTGDHVTKQPFDRQLSNLSNEVRVWSVAKFEIIQILNKS